MYNILVFVICSRDNNIRIIIIAYQCYTNTRVSRDLRVQ